MNDSENPILNECSICFREDIPNDDRCTTNCQHIFCKECLDQWFDLGKSSCPLCRQSIQYFTHQSSENRIINIFAHQNSRTVIPRSQYQTLVTTNARLRCSLSLSTLGLLLFAFLYVNDNLYAEYYNNKLYWCEYNNTLLRQQIEAIHYQENNSENTLDPYILVTLLQDSIIHKCYISLSSYTQCFNF